MSQPLFVTSPLMPALTDLMPYLDRIWESKILTNNGPIHQELESKLQEALDVPCAMLFNNGTIALLTALKLLELPEGSEVITTPLTFAATAHAITWNGLKPVFADVDPQTLTLDPACVEKAVTQNTSAILAVHVYGNICDVEGLQTVADRCGLRLVYDAAHVFGAALNGRSIAQFGDASVFSFHATKLFNTFEGGLIATNRASDKDSIYFLRNFGIKNEEEVVSVGINGKLNEIQAAIGLLNLQTFEQERLKRKALREKYLVALADIPGVTLPRGQFGVINSEQYFHIVIDKAIAAMSRDDVYDRLKLHNIFARKYFHPVCTDFVPYLNWPIHSLQNTSVIAHVKTKLLCLPFHSGVTDKHIETISRVLRGDKGRG